MKAIIAVLFSALSSLGYAQMGGTSSVGGTAYLGQPSGSPTISGISHLASATTISASFTTAAFASPSLACGTSAGSYTIASVDTGIGTALAHQQIVAGLTPSTAYFCQVSATNGSGTVTATFTQTTPAAAASSPILSLSLGTVSAYNSLNASNQGSGDTFYNCKSSDGNTYMTSDDNTGFTISGSPTHSSGGQMNLMKVLSESPLAVQTVQPFANYGAYLPGYLSDGLSSKSSGIFCMDGKLFLALGRQDQTSTQSGGALHQYYGQIIWSADHGASWNYFQNVGNFSTQGTPASPLSASMFGTTPTNMATAEFVHYCADDGTLGYTVPCNQHDNGDAYVYLIANEGAWNGGGTAGGGNAFYIARVPRAKLQNLNGVDYQWFTGGDGSLDANWTATQASATAILGNPGELGEPNVQYVPALNRYLLLTFYYPAGVNGSGANKLDSFWLGYESPHPWGPWTQIFSQEFSGAHGGWYNPVILNDTISAGTTPTVLWTTNYVNGIDYALSFATLTINH